MPNIRGYESPEGLGLRPSETGVEALAGAARRSGAFYNQIADAEGAQGQHIGSTIRDVGDVATKFVEHQEISNGATAFAQKQAELTDTWNQTIKNAKPGDPTVAQKFNQDVLQPALDELNEGFLTEGGQRFAEQKAEALR